MTADEPETETPTREATSEPRPPRGRDPLAAAEQEPNGGAVMVGLSGVFALVVGILLRSAVTGEDRSDWNGIVRAVADGLPTLLIAAGFLVIVWAAVISRRGAEPVEPAGPAPIDGTERAGTRAPADD